MEIRRNWLYKKNLENWGYEPSSVWGLIFQTVGTLTGYLSFPLMLLVPKDFRQYVRQGFIYIYSLLNAVTLTIIIVVLMSGQQPKNLLETSITIYLAALTLMLLAIIILYLVSILFEIFEKLEIWFEPIKEKVKQSKFCNEISKFNELFKIKWK